MSFVDLLEVCLQEATSYAASKHDAFLRTSYFGISEGWYLRDTRYGSGQIIRLDKSH